MYWDGSWSWWAWLVMSFSMVAFWGLVIWAVVALFRRFDRDRPEGSDPEGIPAELLGRVFERFYRVDRARSRADGGSGIGLTIARAIVEAHGGRIRAESDGPGRGSRFVIKIPAVMGQRGQGRRREPVLRPPGRQDP